ESAAPAHTARDERGGRSPVTVLILGGTAEARALAAELDRRGAAFLSSLAGRVSRPRLPVGEVRIGGFGGADGLAAFLTAEQIGAVVDATHPFAVGMRAKGWVARSEEHTSELQSRFDLVCRLLLEKKNIVIY